MRSKSLLVVTVAIIIVGITVVLEFFSPNPVVELPAARYLTFPSEASILSVRSNRTDAWHERQPGETPRYIRAEQDGLLTFHEEIYVKSPAETEYKIVALNDDLVHLRLLSGILAVDSRFSDRTVYVQTDQIAVKPRPYNQFVIEFDDTTSSTKIVSSQGYTDIENHTDPENIAVSFLRPGLVYTDQNILTDNQTLNRLLRVQARLPQLNYDQFLRNKTIPATLLAQSVSPLNSIPILKWLTINPNKRYAVALQAIAGKLNQAREAISIDRPESAEPILAELNTELTEINARALRPTYLEWLKLYGAVPADSSYQAITQTLLTAGYTILTEAQLQNYWLYAVEQQTEWGSGLDSYTGLVSQLLDEEELEAEYSERLYYQLISFPAKQHPKVISLLAQKTNIELERWSALWTQVLTWANANEISPEQLAALRTAYQTGLEQVYTQQGRGGDFLEYLEEIGLN